MRKLTSLMYMFVAATLLFTSCGDDDEPDPSVQKPTITFTSDSEISGDATVASTEGISFKLDLRQGGANLSEFTVREGAGSNAPTAPDDTKYSITDIDGNLVDTEEDGNYSVRENTVYTITFSSKGNEGTFTYVFGLTDRDDVSADALEVTITVKDAAITSYSAKLIQTPTEPEGDNEAFYSASDNSTYSYPTANADASIQSLIDFGYFHNGTDAKLISPIEYSIADGNNDAKNEWTNLNSTMFISSSLDFDGVTVAELQAVDFSSATTSTSGLAENDVVAFKTEAGIYGIFKVNTIDGNFGANDSITIEVKIVE